MTSLLSINASDHKIKSVTVFRSSRAEVVRTFSIELKKGRNRVEISRLPSTIDSQSVRVSGLGQARLFDVVFTIGREKASSHFSDGSPETIRRLLVKKQALESEKSMRERESRILSKYADSLKGEHINPIQMSQFLEKYIDHGQKSIESITLLNEKIVELERLIEVEKDKTSSRRGSLHGKIDIVLFANEDRPIELKLIYIVSNALWLPTYELHATTENGKPSASVSLHYRARVSQQTGEDWDNVALALSTVATASEMRKIPELKPVKMRSTEPDRRHSSPMRFRAQVMARSRSRSRGRSRSRSPRNITQPTVIVIPSRRSSSVSLENIPVVRYRRSSSPERSRLHAQDDINDFAEIPSPLVGKISQGNTIVSETPVAISFSVDGESTIPSDDAEHRVSIAVLPFESHISYVTIPRIDPRVFLQCEVENTSEYRLFPGPVTVILDDSYVSKTSINHVDTGDKFVCNLGDDTSTKVVYEQSFKSAKSEGGTFSEITKTTTYTTIISVHNKHQFPLHNFIIRDVIPTCDDKHVRIVLRKPQGLANAKNGEVVNLDEGISVGWEPLLDGKGGEEEGKLEWKAGVKSGGKVKVEFEWEIKGPENTVWTFD